MIYGGREPAKHNGNTSYVKETGRPGPYGPKSVNLEATFVVARNATNANLYFGEHKIPLNLEGNRSLSARNSPLLPAPAPALSQDARTADFFINGQRGIAVTGVYREFDAESTVGYPAMVDLEVLSLGDYAETDAEDGPNTGSGGVCFGKRGSECLEVLWGPETRFDAILSLEDGEAEAFAEARRGGARWPLPHTVSFIVPHNQDAAVLKFGEHSIPVDLRGMTGAPTYDYTAHYLEARPGAMLYDSEGKTIVLDAITQDPDSGSLELAMTVRNDSEAADFTPALLPSPIFSTTGFVGLTCGVRGETLHPGQSAPLRFIVPRSGNADWGYVTYSPDQEKRPDGVALQMTEEKESGSAAPGVIEPTPVPRNLTAGAQVQPVRLRDCSLDADADRQGSLAGYVKFDRMEDEGKFWPVKVLCRHLHRYGPLGQRGSGITTTVSDGVLYSAYQGGLSAMDAASGAVLWNFRSDSALNGRVLETNGVVLMTMAEERPGTTYALDAASGHLLWDTGRALLGEPVADGMGYRIVAKHDSVDFEILGLDLATDDKVWQKQLEGRGILSRGFSPRTLLATADGVVYVTLAAPLGTLALDAANGDLLWEWEGNFLDDRHIGSMVVADGVVYGMITKFGPDGFDLNGEALVAIDAFNGNLLWRWNTEDFDFHPWGAAEYPNIRLCYADEGIVYGYGGGHSLNGYGLYALDLATGSQLWWLNNWVAHAVANEGVLYATIGDHLYAIQTDASRPHQ